jgi:chloramphenicol 3-O phosphotransferase
MAKRGEASQPGAEGAIGSTSSVLVGHVILLNGTPSSGKTTIARALWDALEPPHWYRSLDDFRQGYQRRHWQADQGPLFDQVFRGFIRSVREMALVGHDVITEAVMLPRNTDAYLDALDGITVYLVGARCPLEVAQRRERERTDRGSGPLDLAIPDFDLVHADRPYDVEFDTSVTSTADAVTLIRTAIAAGRPPTAFDILRARRGARPRTRAPRPGDDKNGLNVAHQTKARRHGV